MILSFSTCLGRGLFIPFFQLLSKKGRLEELSKSREIWNSDQQPMSKPNLHFSPSFSPFQTVLRGNFVIVPETLVKIEIKRFLSKGFLLVGEAQCHDDAKQCDLPSFLLAKEVMTQWWGKMMQWSSFLIGWGDDKKWWYQHDAKWCNADPFWLAGGLNINSGLAFHLKG